jgi:hypothetical protein
MGENSLNLVTLLLNYIWIYAHGLRAEIYLEPFYTDQFYIKNYAENYQIIYFHKKTSNITVYIFQLKHK